jgi:hypothetical protein
LSGTVQCAAIHFQQLTLITDTRVARDAAKAIAGLMLVVVDSHPGRAHIVAAEDALLVVV